MDRNKLSDNGFNHLRRCRHGLMLYNVHDQFVGRSLERYGEFSEAEIAIFRQLLRPGDVVVDVGANLGAHTLYFANAVGPQGMVYALEPQRLIFQTLCANMALNSITNTVCLWAAAGAHPGTLTVPVLDPERSLNFGGLELGNPLPGESVALHTVDSLALPRCRLLKIDVEGMELEVLQGAQETLARHCPVLYVENDRLDRSDELIRRIIACGYTPYWHTPPLFHPDNYDRQAENVFKGIVSANLLCVHPRQHIHLEGFQRSEPGVRHPLDHSVNCPQPALQAVP